MIPRYDDGYIVIDTEYLVNDERSLTILGILGKINGQFVATQLDWPSFDIVKRQYYSEQVKGLVQDHTVVFHNAQADIAVLEKNLSIQYNDYGHIEDTMLAHAVLWSELPHDLEFLGSIYGKYGKYKHLLKTDPFLYNFGDLLDTACLWESLSTALQQDRQACKVYRNQSLAIIPTLLEAEKQGIRVDKNETLRLFHTTYGELNRIKNFAELMVGYPINLNSGKQLQHYLYSERDYTVQIDKDTKRPTTGDEAISYLRQSIYPFDAQKELSFDTSGEKTESLLERVEHGADPILECRALWGQTWHNLNNYLVGLAKGVYNESSEGKRKKTRKEIWERGLQERDLVDRIYPSFGIHSQRTSRWSTTNPPLAQLPSSFRGIICPDPEEVCLTWDWKAIEPRVLQALTGSTLLKKTFDENFDLHTWTVCYMFGYELPPDLVDPHKSESCKEWRIKYNWLGKDDPRRVFAKEGRYEMWYGGSGSNAAARAAMFGLNAKTLKDALGKLAVSDPHYLTWRVKIEDELRRTSMIRTFMGRPRRFLNQGHKRLREGLDQPMQGAVSDIFNTTFVLIKDTYPWARWGYGMHDSQKWYMSIHKFTKEVFQKIKSIVEREFDVYGTITRFPGDFEIILPPERGCKVLTPEEYFTNLEVLYG